MMSRIEFMNELESLLYDIPIEERQEALQYYNDYFEDAGTDHEEEIIRELVSPQRVASIIKANLNINDTDSENRGYFTEKGYQDTLYENERYEIIGTDAKKSENQETTNDGSAGSTENRNGRLEKDDQQTYENNSQQDNQQHSRQSTNDRQQEPQTKKSNTGLIVLLTILSFPIWLPIVCTIFGIAIAIFATVFGIVLGFGAAGISMMIGGIAFVVLGLIEIGIPMEGLLFCGSGLIVLGLGMLFTLATVALCKSMIPAMVRGFVNVCRYPFKNRRAAA